MTKVNNIRYTKESMLDGKRYDPDTEQMMETADEDDQDPYMDVQDVWSSMAFLQYPDIELVGCRFYWRTDIDGCVFGIRRLKDGTEQSVVLSIEDGTILQTFDDSWAQSSQISRIYEIYIDDTAALVDEAAHSFIIVNWKTGGTLGQFPWIADDPVLWQKEKTFGAKVMERKERIIMLSRM